MERRALSLWSFDSFTEDLRRRSLIKLRTNADIADCFQEPHRSETCHFTGVFGHVKADSDMRLSAEVVNLVRRCLAEDRIERAGIIEVAINQAQARARLMRILIEMIDPIGIESR